MWRRRCPPGIVLSSGIVVVGAHVKIKVGQSRRRRRMACQGVQSAERNSKSVRADRRRRRSAWSATTRTWRRGCVVPQCVRSQAVATGELSPSRRMAPGTGIRRCRSRGQRPGWAHSARTCSWRAAMTSRSSRASNRPSMPAAAMGASSRASSWSRSRCHGMAPVPFAAWRNRATPAAGPLTVRVLRSQSGFQGPSGPWRVRAGPDLSCWPARFTDRAAGPGCRP